MPTLAIITRQTEDGMIRYLESVTAEEIEAACGPYLPKGLKAHWFDYAKREDIQHTAKAALLRDLPIAIRRRACSLGKGKMSVDILTGTPVLDSPYGLLYGGVNYGLTETERPLEALRLAAKAAYVQPQTTRS